MHYYVADMLDKSHTVSHDWLCCVVHSSLQLGGTTTLICQNMNHKLMPAKDLVESMVSRQTGRIR